MRVDFRFALTLLALTFAGVAAADWKRDYRLGLRAIQSGDWAEAEQLFRSAARQDATPTERKRFEGVVFDHYVPQHYAAVAAWRQGACDRAMDYWQTAGLASAVGKLGAQKGEMDQGMSACRQQLAAATRPPDPAPTAPAPAPDQVATAPRPSPPVATPTTTPTTTPPTTQPTAPTPTRPVATTTPPPRPAPSRPAPTAAPAPAALTGAVDAWLAGRYDDIVRIDPNREGDGRARAQLFLFRAAARHVQAELAGADLDPAREDVRAARRALASISPDTSLFSPRFRSFWQQTR